MAQSTTITRFAGAIHVATKGRADIDIIAGLELDTLVDIAHQNGEAEPTDQMVVDYIAWKYSDTESPT